MFNIIDNHNIKFNLFSGFWIIQIMLQSLIKNGNNAIYAKNFTGAISYFDQALKINPNNTNALINKGVALGNLQNFTGAISYFDQALKINPNNTDAIKQQRCCFNQGR